MQALAESGGKTYACFAVLVESICSRTVPIWPLSPLAAASRQRGGGGALLPLLLLLLGFRPRLLLLLLLLLLRRLLYLLLPPTEDRRRGRRAGIKSAIFFKKREYLIIYFGTHDIVLPSSRDAPEWSVSKGRPRSSPSSSPLAAAAEERGPGGRSARRRRRARAADCKGGKTQIVGRSITMFEKKSNSLKKGVSVPIGGSRGLIGLSDPTEPPCGGLF